MQKNQTPFVINDLNEDLGFLLFRIASLWEAAHQKVLSRYNIKHIDFTILASAHWLNLHETKNITQITLSKHTKVPPMTVSQTLKSLEQKGYLIRTNSTSDLRTKICTLTPSGVELVNDAFGTIIKADTRFFGSLTGVHRKKFNEYMVELFENNDI